jgi:MFS family permease
VHQVAYLESLGYARQHASAFVGFAGLLTAVAYIGWGPISDRIGRRTTFTLGSLCLCGAVLVFWILARLQFQSDGLLLIYSACYALAEGTRSSQPTAMAADHFGYSRLGLVTGTVGAMFGLGAAFAPWLVGRLVDLTGSYDLGFQAVIIMVVMSIIGAFGVHRYGLRAMESIPA